MPSGATLRRRLVRELEGRDLLHDPAVRDAFLRVPREQFVPEFAAENGLEAVYEDRAVLTKKTGAGHGLSSSSQPAIMVKMLEELRLEPGQRVLEVGAGTGYNAALVAAIVGDSGKVVSVDIDPDVAREARRHLRGIGVQVVTGDGRAGYPPGAPYDRIVVTASAEEVSRAWLEQLKPDGLLVTPLRLRGADAIHLIPALRRENGKLRSISTICGGFMPLRSSADDLSPYWPSLNLTQHVGAESTRLLSVYGEALRDLPPPAARRLAGVTCSPPATRTLPIRAPGEALAAFLAVKGPVRKLVSAFDGRDFLIGLISRDGRSLALLKGWRRTSSLQVHGGDSAADELHDLVLEWHRRGRPELSDLDITVAFRNGCSTIRTRWRGR